MLDGLWLPIPSNKWLRRRGFKTVSKKLRRALRRPAPPVQPGPAGFPF